MRYEAIADTGEKNGSQPKVEDVFGALMLLMFVVFTTAWLIG